LGKVVVGFSMMQTLFLDDLESLISAFELELNCSILLNYLLPETLLLLLFLWVEPDSLSSWKIYYSATGIRRSSSFMMRMF
jgi:hypothetical protein